MTITKAAKNAPNRAPRMSFVLNGKSDLSIELAAKIEDVFGYSALKLLQHQAELKLNEYRNVKGSVILPVFHNDPFKGFY